MNYQRIYFEFISNRRLTESALEHSSFEIHHIVPRCLGGTEEVANLIRLSLEDHLFAHRLLAKVYGGNLLTAFILMSNLKKYQGRHSRFGYASEKRRFIELKRQQAIAQWDDEARREKQRKKIYLDRPWDTKASVEVRKAIGSAAGKVAMSNPDNVEKLRQRSYGNRFSADNRDPEAFREMRRRVAKGNKNASGKRSPESVENIRKGTIAAHARKKLRAQQETQGVPFTGAPEKESAE